MQDKGFQKLEEALALKKLIQLLFFVPLMLIFTFVADAQTQTAPVKNEQPKVVKAAAPDRYPSGNIKGATGDLRVEVKINFLGEVTSATAISGHRILRPICVKAAKLWMFESIEDKNRERTAILTFNFQKSEKEDSGIFFKPPYTIEFFHSEVR